MSALQLAQLSAVLFAASIPLGVLIGYRWGQQSRPLTEREVLLGEWRELQQEYRLLVHTGYLTNARALVDRISAVERRIIATGDTMPQEERETWPV